MIPLKDILTELARLDPIAHETLLEYARAKDISIPVLRQYALNLIDELNDPERKTKG